MRDLTADRMSALIGAVYECALDPSQWPVFFALLEETGNFDSGALFVMEPQKKSVRFSAFWGVTMQTLAAIEQRHSNDPTMVFLQSLLDPARDPDEPAIYHQVFDDAFLEKSPLYHEITATHGIVDSVATLALSAPHRFGVLSALRSEGERFGSREAELLRLLAPHVRRTVTIADLIDMKQLQRNAFSAALDGLSVPVVLVNASAQPLHVNAAAKLVLDKGAPLLLQGGKLATSTPGATEHLQAAIAGVQAGKLPADGPTPSPGLRGVALPTSKGAPAIAHVLPLAGSGPAAAAVFVATDSISMRSTLTGIGAMHGLSAAEQRVLEALADGTVIQAVADALHLSVSTVKTHTQRIYDKIGVTRHAELVALLAALAPPAR
jgi:DNA-binding CsgD family transcriptional regulator